jgi:hypothetical protein
MTGRFWLLGICVLIASFLTTFWLTASGTPIKILMNSEVSDENGLSEAAISAGLRPALAMRGTVDQINRLSASQVRLWGWSADPNGNGKPITVIAFADGKVALETRTNGPRPDVTDSLKLPDAAARNVVFEGFLSCRPGQPLFVIAITGDAYVKLHGAAGTLLCPS